VRRPAGADLDDDLSPSGCGWISRRVLKPEGSVDGVSRRRHSARQLFRHRRCRLLIGGLWEFRSGELFGGTFGVGYAGFLFSTALILKFFAVPIIGAAGPLAFDHAFAAWLIMWALFTAVFAIGASSISLAAFAPFTLAFLVLVLLAIANLGGTASWTADVSKIGGWVAIADGFAAGYLGAAIVLNVTLSKELLPMWPARSRPKT
jgi:succinate-acetate transporter protein